MTLSAGLRRTLLGITAVVLVVVYLPLALVVLNSFNTNRTFAWPPTGLTLHWWPVAAQSDGARSALWVSVKVALLATVIALVLGTMAAMGLQRYRFFGRDAVSLLIVLPIALPGIVTGIALNNAFRTVLGIDLGFVTIVVAHATFCIVTVFNNVQARLRRLGGASRRRRWTSAPEALTTFLLVTFPMLRRRCSPAGCSPSRCRSTRSS